MIKTSKVILALLSLTTLISSAALAQPTELTQTVRIALVSDPHINVSTEGDAANYTGRFRQAITAVNDANVDFVLLAGDLMQSGKTEEIAAYKKEVQAFRAPVRHVYGNHDVGAKKGITGAKPGDGINSARLQRIENALGPSFFSETLSGIRVVGLNASLLGSSLPEEKNQWAFLEKTLALQTSAAPITLILTHYPLYLTEPQETGGGYWNVEPAPRKRLLALLEKNNRVRAVLSGHLHRGITGSGASGIFHITTLPVSFGLPAGRQPEGWTLITMTLPLGSIQTEFRLLPALPAADPEQAK